MYINNDKYNIAICGNFVIVRQYKFDTIRQEYYWAVVNKMCRKFKNRKAAEEYAARIIKEV